MNLFESSSEPVPCWEIYLVRIVMGVQDLPEGQGPREGTLLYCCPGDPLLPKAGAPHSRRCLRLSFLYLCLFCQSVTGYHVNSGLLSLRPIITIFPFISLTRLISNWTPYGALPKEHPPLLCRNDNSYSSATSPSPVLTHCSILLHLPASLVSLIINLWRPSKNLQTTSPLE